MVDLEHVEKGVKHDFKKTTKELGRISESGCISNGRCLMHHQQGLAGVRKDIRKKRKEFDGMFTQVLDIDGFNGCVRGGCKNV